MTTIKEINEQLKTAKHPVAKTLHKGDNFKVLVIGFKKGMKLKEHQANLSSKLTVNREKWFTSKMKKKLKLIYLMKLIFQSI